jgi:acyl dehydratase
MSTHTWTLTPEAFAATEAKLEKINARAHARGFTGRLDLTGTEREITETDTCGLTRTRIVIDTTITGEAPNYGGWRFLAAVDTVPTDTDTTDFVLRAAPGVNTDSIDRDTLVAGHCDHCNAVRANRRYTFLVEHVDTGQTMQVGSTCLRDFTGWATTPVFIDLDDTIDKLDGTPTSGGQAAYTPETIVAIAWAATQARGWKAGGGTTSDVAAYLYGTSKTDAALRQEMAEHLGEKATTTARTIIRELLDELDSGGSYAQNLLTCLSATHVAPKHLGITVSAIAAHHRMTGKQPESRRREDTARTTRYAGEVGEKLTLTGTITLARAFETQYGYQSSVSNLLIVEADTTVAKMFTSAAWSDDVQVGDTVTLTATVKDHEDYRGVKTTVLTRPKCTAHTRGETAA